MRYDAPATREERLKNVPVEMDAMADAVLRYRPRNKAKKLKPRKRPPAPSLTPSRSDGRNTNDTRSTQGP